MHLRRLLLLAFIITLFSTHAPLHAQEGITCPGFLPSRLTVGAQGQVTPGASNNLRAEPSRDAVKVGQIPGGGSFTILDGPVCAEDTIWWHVDYQGLSGWTVEGLNGEYWLEPIQVCESNLVVGEPAERLEYGEGRIFEQPDLDSPVLGEVPEWTTFDVIGGPHCDDLLVWVEIEYEGITGWFLAVGWTYCDYFCDGPSIYLNARRPLLPLQTAVPTPGVNPLLPRRTVNLSSDAITAANADQVTTLKILGDGFIRGYAWSPDESHLAVAGSVEVRVYETRRLTAPPHVLTGFTGVVSKVLYSPDGRLLVTADLDGNVRLWDTETYELLFTLDHGEPAGEVLFDEDGSLLAVGGNTVISLWEINGLEQPQLRHSIELPNGGNHRAGTLAFVPGKNQLLDVRWYEILVHDVTTGESRPLWADESLQRSIHSWALSPDGRYIAAIMSDMMGDTHMVYSYFLSSWNTETGQRGEMLYEGENGLVLQLFGDQIPYIAVEFDQSGAHILIIRDNRQEVLGLETKGNTGWLFDLQDVIDVEPDSNSSLLAFGMKTGEVRLYARGQPLDILYGIKGTAGNLKFSPDGTYLAARGSDNTLRVWNVETRQRLGTIGFVGFPSEFFPGSEQNSLIANQQVWDIASGQRGVSFSLPEGAKLLQVRDDGWLLLKGTNGIIVYDPETEEILLEVPVGLDYYSFPTLSTDGNWLAHVEVNQLDSSLSVVKVVNLNDGALAQTFQRQFEEPWGLFLSPDGRFLILSDYGRTTSVEPDPKLLLWEVATGNLLHTISTPDEHISNTNLIFSPDGTQIAWRADGRVRIYNLLNQTMAITEDMEGFAWQVPAFAFNADGSLIAVGDAMGEIHLFDTSTGEEVATLKGHISPMRKLVFSHDGRRLYSMADEGLLRIWGVP